MAHDFHAVASAPQAHSAHAYQLYKHALFYSYISFHQSTTFHDQNCCRSDHRHEHHRDRNYKLCMPVHKVMHVRVCLHAVSSRIHHSDAYFLAKFEGVELCSVPILSKYSISHIISASSEYRNMML